MGAEDKAAKGACQRLPQLPEKAADLDYVRSPRPSLTDATIRGHHPSPVTMSRAKLMPCAVADCTGTGPSLYYVLLPGSHYLATFTGRT